MEEQVPQQTESTSTENKLNKGENDEIKYKKIIFENRENLEYLVPVFGADASDGIEIINPKTNTPYTDISQIKKADSFSKADMIILFKKTNETRYCSMKSLRGQRPTLLNHTHRNAKVFQTEMLDSLQYFDKIAAEYIDKRTQKKIGEDVAFSKLACLREKEIRESVVKLLSYFVFTGTGAKRSPKECDCILIIHKNGTLTFIDCDTDEKKTNYINTIIDTCIISFRNKGMPVPTKINLVHLPWIYTNESSCGGKQCGSIHIRL
jgi:hypothetical protein